ncbi:hypothetical protein D3C73_1369820 [compost metagenome]
MLRLRQLRLGQLPLGPAGHIRLGFELLELLLQLVNLIAQTLHLAVLVAVAGPQQHQLGAHQLQLLIQLASKLALLTL